MTEPSTLRLLLDWLDQHLVDGWRAAWRWFSIQAMALNIAFLATWAVLPEDIKSVLPSWLVAAVAIALLVLGIAGRLKDQPK